MANMLKGKAEILCDDRIIIRKQPLTAHRSPLTVHRTPLTAFRIYGTWSHGDVSDVSSNSAPLKAILFLHKAKENRLELIKDKKITHKKLLSCLIKPFVTRDWWDKMLTLTDEISGHVPCYELYFDKSGKVADALRKL